MRLNTQSTTSPIRPSVAEDARMHSNYGSVFKDTVVMAILEWLKKLWTNLYIYMNKSRNDQRPSRWSMSQWAPMFASGIHHQPSGIKNTHGNKKPMFTSYYSRGSMNVAPY